MLFNSLDFAVFLLIVFVVYWFFTNKNLRAQNIFILFSSYVFYGWWDWRFLSLIVVSTLVDYSVGLGFKKFTHPLNQKILLSTSIIVNLGILGFFKYYNFFIENLIETYAFFGGNFRFNSLYIILPVGISFYTFQTLSYTIDIYRKKLEPTRDFIAFAAFVSFFPQLVAGPIERAKQLLPQFFSPRSFNYSNTINGFRQILWGLFKKIVIADTCAEYVNLIFNNSDIYSGSTLFIGVFLFAFQIYGDFSGYSDIAIGTAKLFGFELMKNFAFPYFSRDIAEFWRRWHISLSTWFRDYLYIPLGGSKGGMLNKLRNTFIIFTVSGFWHGANWTFIIWGAINAIYFIPLLLLRRNRKNIDIVAKGKIVPPFKELSGIFITFCLTLLAWIFFRAENISHALSYVSGILSYSIFTVPEVFPIYLLLVIGLFVCIEWLQREKEYVLEINKFPQVLRWGIYISMGWFIMFFAATNDTQDFIYFQF